jgi:hypothetical protein
VRLCKWLLFPLCLQAAEEGAEHELRAASRLADALVDKVGRVYVYGLCVWIYVCRCVHACVFECAYAPVCVFVRMHMCVHACMRL